MPEYIQYGQFILPLDEVVLAVAEYATSAAPASLFSDPEGSFADLMEEVIEANDLQPVAGLNPPTPPNR